MASKKANPFASKDKGGMKGGKKEPIVEMKREKRGGKEAC